MSNQSGKDLVGKAWVSFCMSTYKRPDFLRRQLEIISRQTFSDFQVIISDNDPEASGRNVVEEFNDSRVFYFLNENNIGMVKSFNRSLAKANAEYIVMITDDDPVYPEMLQDFFKIIALYPGFPVYCGCKRANRDEGKTEVFDKDNFVFQMLNPRLTTNILWSSCLLKREVVVAIGGMPDYGSPHLADHALLALCSKQGGGVMINKMYSELSSHSTNFSKSNFELYYIGCVEFHKLIKGLFDESAYIKGRKNALAKHLEVWFIANAFNLKKYFAHKRKDPEASKNASTSLIRILSLPFMQNIYPRYLAKLVIFYIKYPFYYFRMI